MAKRQSTEEKPNKSQAIREALAADKSGSPTAVAAAVNEKYGYTVTPAFVSIVKSQDKKKAGMKVRVRRSSVRSSGGGVIDGNGATSDTLLAAVKLVESAGGIDGARAAIDLLDRLKQTL